MIIAVASGKGGTGKTTVSTNLALSIDKTQFIDCDVEEPNANIFLKLKENEKKHVNVDIPFIDKKKCDLCGKCADFCAYNAIAVVPSNILVFPELCHSCGGCKLVCPKDAINWNKKNIGVIMHSESKDIDFYQGILNIGEIQAIPLIKALKKNIDKQKNTIIDVPPGTACPMIESINGSNYCILVTEPTPFGLNDLKLAVQTVRHLNIPFGVIINRNGIGDERVELYCKKEYIQILLKIPESEKIANLYSKGNALVKEDSDWKKTFLNVFNKIKEDVFK